MPLTLIEQNKSREEQGFLPLSETKPNICTLNVAEMFANTIQGEGVNTGHPATFLRLQGCTLKCVWCDTLGVWPNGSPYHSGEIFKLLEDNKVIEELRRGQHLVLTGGSPLKQQEALITFIKLFKSKYGFIPYLEIENEAVLIPNPELIPLIDCWNNSPKLSNSGMKRTVRYKPDVLHKLANLPNSWFKFVIANESDLNEIIDDFINEGIINRKQVILMPEGQTQEELSLKREWVADQCVKHGFKFSDRLHIAIWNKKTGV